MNQVLLGVLIYVGLQLLVGVVVSRRIASEEDYLLAGRSLGLGFATFTIFATWFGAETCISSAGAFYENGLAGGSADPFGYGICILFMGVLFAVPLWKRKLTTLADLFRDRYSTGVERFAVVLMAPTSVMWAAAQIRAFGQVLDAASGVGFATGVVLATVVVIIYTASGGLRADVITDLIQGGVIIVGLIVILFLVLDDIPNVSQVIKDVPPERLNPFATDNGILDILEAWMVPICGSVVAQELVSRILASRSPGIARNSCLAGGVLYILIGMIPAFLGLIAFKLLPDLKEPEQVLPLLAKEHLSTFFYILFAGALVSAILSTVDSTLLAASGLLAHNLVIPLSKNMPESRKLFINRALVVTSGIIAAILALSAESIYNLVENASSFGSSGIFVIMLMGLFTRFGGPKAGHAAIIFGLVVWIIASMNDFAYPFMASLAAAFAGYFLVGWIENRQADQTLLATET